MFGRSRHTEWIFTPVKFYVHDLPCPKCGSEDTKLLYCDGIPTRHLPIASAPKGEHFDRSCGRCHYAWFTTDVLAAQERVKADMAQVLAS